MAALEARLRANGDPFVVTTTVPGEHPSTPREIETRLPKLALVLWVGGGLQGVPLRYCQSRDIPVLIVAPDIATLDSLPGRWMPGRRRAILDPITHLYATREADVGIFLRAGLEPSQTTLSEPLEEVVSIPRFDVEEMRHLTRLTGTRPLWLAAAIGADEVPSLVAAQQHAARRSHRLMLIACPAEGEDDAAIGRGFMDSALSTALRAEGQEPDDATQVYVADGQSEIGLWLRMAGISYLGGSFGPAARLDPFVAASLGSVVIHGAKGGTYADRLARLRGAGATCPIRTPEDIGSGVEALLSVGDAAKHAAAGWEVVSRGAELTNALVQRITELTDRRSAAR